MASNWEPKRDHLSGIPVQHLTFILNYFLPTRHFALGTILEREENYEGMFEYLGAAEKVIFSGSLAEGVGVPSYYSASTGRYEMPSDIDFMIVDKRYLVFEKHHQSTDKMPLAIDDTECHPGFVRFTSSKGRKYVDRFSEDFNREAPSRIPNLDSVERHGPARQFFFRKSYSEAHPGLIMSTGDSVDCLVCDEWPEVADEWKARERSTGWPGQDLVTKITDEGCHLVQVPHPLSSRPEGEWRLSFSAAEKVLLRSLSSVQRKCLVLFKLAVSHAFSCETPAVTDLLSSYHLKTTLLYTCEEIPATEFNEHSVGQRYLGLLDKLIAFLEDGNLPNYFVRENNMISHILKDKETILTVLRRLRKSPLEIFLNFDEHNRFIYLYDHHGMKLILSSVFNDMYLIQDGKPGIGLEKLIVPAFETIIDRYLTLRMYLDTVDTLTKLLEFKKCLFGIDISILSLLQERLNNPLIRRSNDQITDTSSFVQPPGELWKDEASITLTASIFWEFIWEFYWDTHATKNTKELFATYSSRKRFWSSLARYFLKRMSKIKLTLSFGQRNDMQHCIHRAFVETLADDNMAAKDILDSYSWLIFVEKEYRADIAPEKDLLQLLQAHLDPEYHEWIPISDVKEFVTYDRDDRYLITDPLLKLEIFGAGYIRVPTTVYLHYLRLVRAVGRHGRTSDQADISFAHMLQVCRKFVTCEYSPWKIAIFGYGLMYMGLFEQAFSFFRFDHMVGNQRKHTLKTMALCLGLIVHEELVDGQVRGVPASAIDLQLQDWVSVFIDGLTGACSGYSKPREIEDVHSEHSDALNVQKKMT